MLPGDGTKKEHRLWQGASCEIAKRIQEQHSRSYDLADPVVRISTCSIPLIGIGCNMPWILLRALGGSVLSDFRSIDIKSCDQVIEVPHSPEDEHISHGFAMRFFPFWILAFESAMITSSAAYTYWVDASCSNRKDWNAYLTEARDMATKANTRLRSSTDSDYANIFKRVFKADKSDKNAFDAVTGNSNSILYTTRPWTLIPW